MMVVIFRLMPDSMRRKRVSQKNAPRTITKWDLHDEFGESPYRVTEVVADKLWSTVHYSTVQYSTVQYRWWRTSCGASTTGSRTPA